MKVVYADMSIKEIEEFILLIGLKVKIKISDENGYSSMLRKISYISLDLLDDDDCIITNNPLAIDKLKDLFEEQFDFDTFMSNFCFLNDTTANLVLVKSCTDKILCSSHNFCNLILNDAF